MCVLGGGGEGGLHISTHYRSDKQKEEIPSSSTILYIDIRDIASDIFDYPMITVTTTTTQRLSKNNTFAPRGLPTFFQHIVLLYYHFYIVIIVLLL